MRNWLLPEYIEDVLPPEAERMERLRSRLLILFRGYGYHLVAPPLLEYTESLLTGTGHDLDLRIFKLVDQLSGRMMGVRADITPQVARIDAHLLNQNEVTRLCYCGPVLHTRPRGMNVTREPMQIGAELYGHVGIEADLEMLHLLGESVVACGVTGARVDIGHVGVFRALIRRAGISADLEALLHQAMVAKDREALSQHAAALDPVLGAALVAMSGLYGDPSVLQKAAKVLPAHPEIVAALQDLARLAAASELPVTIDLADLRGYQYHSGAVFAVYAPGMPNALALGGRYDEVGAAFGRARPATGFSMDLRDLARVVEPSPPVRGILAPWTDDRALMVKIAELRAAGERVIQALSRPEQSGHVAGDNPVEAGLPHALECDRELVLQGDQWILRRKG
jgi:ATP phosphoribosyltransferase regulatory subunit